MRTSSIVVTACLSAASALAAVPAHADYVQTANPPPPSSTTPTVTEKNVPRAPIHREGLEAQGGLGTGFAGTYAFGLEARVGYTWQSGIYLGGNAQYYFGNSVNNTNAYAFFIGPEIAYKIFPVDQLEVRPFVFVGLGFNKQVSDNPFSTNSHNTVAVQPGALVLWHFNQTFYAGGDGHFFVYPSPVSFGLLAIGGANF
jgi:hypothetical protein